MRAALAVAALTPALFACGEPPEPAVPPEATARALPRALWVLAEGSQRVLEHPERVPSLLEDARLLGASDLFVQVYRGGRAWFDSRHADAAPFRAARAAAGSDPLADLLRRAHAAGLRVHAWVNVLSLARNREAPLLRSLGPDAVLMDRYGRSLLDYPDLEIPEPHGRYYRMGTRGVYLDPAARGLADLLAETFAELLERYPELDGLHLDYIRYPDVLPFVPGSRFGVGLDFGYGQETRARFRRETGLDAPTGDATGNADRWDAWRREKLTELVAHIAERARATRPGIALSAAVWAYADRSYLALGQDWRGWLEEGLLDFAVPMAYTRDDRLFRYQAEAFANIPGSARIWIGMGTWLFAGQPERALAQIRLARTAGVAGEALFSYDSIASAPALREALIAEVQRER
ncbi:MAG TPA: family 10 glycosylhydrolase [Myxococcota bacterium]